MGKISRRQAMAYGAGAAAALGSVKLIHHLYRNDEKPIERTRQAEERDTPGYLKVERSAVVYPVEKEAPGTILTYDWVQSRYPGVKIFRISLKDRELAEKLGVHGAEETLLYERGKEIERQGFAATPMVLDKELGTHFGGLDTVGRPYKPIPSCRLALKTGDPAPEFQALTTDKKRISLEENRGKVVLLHFWLGNSIPGQHEAREIMRVGRAYQGLDFRQVWISADEESPRFLPAGPWDHIFDGEDGPLATKYQIETFPQVYLIDKKGIIRRRDTHTGKLDEKINELLLE